MAMLGDPQGAPFYLMDPVPPPGQPDAQSDVFESKTPGHCWWNELETTDEPGATAFYTALFGWSAEQTHADGRQGRLPLRRSRAASRSARSTRGWPTT